MLGLCLVGLGDKGGLVSSGFWPGVPFLVVWWLSFPAPVSWGPFVLGSGVFGGVGVGKRVLCGYSAFWHVERGAGGCSGIGFCDGGYLVFGVAAPVGIPGVPWSGLGCCGWLGGWVDR